MTIYICENVTFLSLFWFIAISALCTINYTNGQGTLDFQCNSEASPKHLPFCLLEDYEKDLPHLIEKPLNIMVLCTFDDVLQINDADSTITFSMTLAITWTDDRIQILSNSSHWRGYWGDGKMKWSQLHTDWLGHLWHPDIDVANVKYFAVKTVKEEQASLDLSEDKTLWYEFPVQVTLNCPRFDFRTYPLDTQICEFFIGSYRHSAEENAYHGYMWYNKSRQRALQYDVRHIQALTFEEGLIDYREYYYSSKGVLAYENVSYSQFGVTMEFRRLLQPHLICTYLPSFFLVVCSWLAFLIEPSCIPGRVVLSVTVLLVLMNIR